MSGYLPQSFFGESIVSHSQYINSSISPNDIRIPNDFDSRHIYRDLEGNIRGNNLLTHIGSHPYEVKTKQFTSSSGYNYSLHHGREYNENTLTSLHTGEVINVYTNLESTSTYTKINGKMYYVSLLPDKQVHFISCETGKILYNFQSLVYISSCDGYIVFCGGGIITIVTPLKEAF